MEVIFASGEAANLYPEGSRLPVSAFVCLPEDGGEVSFVVPGRAVFSLSAGQCGDASEAVPLPPEVAPGGESEQWSAGGGAVVLRSVGPDAAQFPQGRRLAAGDRVCLRLGSRVLLLTQDTTRTIQGPGCHAVSAQQSRPGVYYLLYRNDGVRGGVRGGSVRGSSAAYMLVVRGSPNALVWYPMGRRVNVSARICLPDSAHSITFEKFSGGTVTYGGGGCNRVIADPPIDPGARSGGGSGP